MDGDEIRKTREERGWSQTELANKMGVAASQISRWESGRTISRRNLNQIKLIFGMKAVAEQIEGAPYRGMGESLSNYERHDLWQKLAEERLKRLEMLEHENEELRAKLQALMNVEEIKP